jgi:acyl-CoA thioesterase-1
MHGLPVVRPLFSLWSTLSSIPMHRLQPRGWSRCPHPAIPSVIHWRERIKRTTYNGVNPVIYAALGDSITSGAGLPSPRLAYPARTIQRLALLRAGAQRSNASDVLAEPGWTSQVLLAALRESPPDALVEADAVSIWVGGDDLAYAALSAIRAPAAIRTKALKLAVERALRVYAINLAQLVCTVRCVSRGRLVLFTQYNPFPNTSVAEEAIGALNAVTRREAARCGAVLADAADWFEGHQAAWIQGYRTGRIQDVLAGSRFPIHPNRMGHQVIADRLATLLAT